MIRVITKSIALQKEFEDCCKYYDNLRISVAWCGDPKYQIPYKLLSRFSGNLSICVGISFNQTHPDGIKYFMEAGYDVRIYSSNTPLFHPKIYRFTKGDEYAVFVGSSNFTHGGFVCNREANVLMKGKFVDEPLGQCIQCGAEHRGIADLFHEQDSWFDDSFQPTDDWLSEYRKEYLNNQNPELEFHDDHASSETSIEEKRAQAVRGYSGKRGLPFITREAKILYTFQNKEINKEINEEIRACVVVSKNLEPSSPSYWYGYNEKTDVYLNGASGQAYLILACIDRNEAFAIPHEEIHRLLPEMSVTVTASRTYWHIHIITTASGGLALKLSKGGSVFNLSKYMFKI